VCVCVRAHVGLYSPWPFVAFREPLVLFLSPEAPCYEGKSLLCCMCGFLHVHICVCGHTGLKVLKWVVVFSPQVQSWGGLKSGKRWWDLSNAPYLKNVRNKEIKAGQKQWPSSLRGSSSGGEVPWDCRAEAQTERHLAEQGLLIICPND